MQIYMRICPICANENKKEAGHSKIYVPGWNDSFINEDYADTTCLYHENQKLIKVAMTCEEFQVLRQISNEPSFMQAMNDLKEKDIIEYNLKLSQFKTQLSQTSQVEDNKKPKCPHCHSNNIQKIGGLERVGSITMLGIFSNKINKSFKCKDCGYTW